MNFTIARPLEKVRMSAYHSENVEIGFLYEHELICYFNPRWNLGTYDRLACHRPSRLRRRSDG